VAGLEAERDPHRIGRNHLFGAGHVFGPAPATRIRRTQPRLDHAYALDLAVADDLDRLAVEQEGHALLDAVLVVAARARHVVGIAAIGAGHRGCALAHGRAVAVHAGVATAQHHHALA